MVYHLAWQLELLPNWFVSPSSSPTTLLTPRAQDHAHRAALG